FAHDPGKIARIEAAAAPRDGMETKSFSLDCSAVAVDARCHLYLEARVAGCARHRKTVRDEVPVFGHEIDHAPHRPRHCRAPAIATLRKRQNRFSRCDKESFRTGILIRSRLADAASARANRHLELFGRRNLCGSVVRTAPLNAIGCNET